MSPVYKLSANSVKNGRTVYGSMLAGNTAYVPPSFESIATVTVGSGGAADIEFTSIPATFAHLQVRCIARGSASANTVQVDGRVNGDTGNNYAHHTLYADGSSVSAFATSTTNAWNFQRAAAATAGSNTFGTLIIDFLDYANTNKYKTVRELGGIDNNGSGVVSLHSGLWMNTNAITSIKLYPNSGNWAQYSHFALYGIKGAA